MHRTFRRNSTGNMLLHSDGKRFESVVDMLPFPFNRCHYGFETLSTRVDISTMSRGKSRSLPNKTVPKSNSTSWSHNLTSKWSVDFRLRDYFVGKFSTSGLFFWEICVEVEICVPPKTRDAIRSSPVFWPFRLSILVSKSRF